MELDTNEICSFGFMWHPSALTFCDLPYVRKAEFLLPHTRVADYRAELATQGTDNKDPEGRVQAPMCALA